LISIGSAVLLVEMYEVLVGRVGNVDRRKLLVVVV
jgi:hypothetical protein